MFTERTSVGLDVHARSVVAGAIDGVTGEVFPARLTPGNEAVIDWVRALPGPVAAVYETGPTGLGRPGRSRRRGSGVRLRRPRRSSDRVVTGSRPIPGMRCIWPSCCAWTRSSRWPCPVWRRKPRDLVRAREDVRGDLMRARHRVSKLLLRQGIVYYGGSAWTGVHLVWMR